ncbi:hypothetical protein HAX54_000897, partial [Datura stramonium]|nr:hypothetical protein [Datura stramonium]
MEREGWQRARRRRRGREERGRRWLHVVVGKREMATVAGDDIWWWPSVIWPEVGGTGERKFGGFGVWEVRRLFSGNGWKNGGGYGRVEEEFRRMLWRAEGKERKLGAAEAWERREYRKNE